MSQLSDIYFHMSTLDKIYLVVNFGSSETYDLLAEKYTLDEFEIIGEGGHMMLDDNGCDFECPSDCLDTLYDAFSIAIDEGLISKETIKGQVRYWPGGVDRSVFQ